MKINIDTIARLSVYGAVAASAALIFDVVRTPSEEMAAPTAILLTATAIHSISIYHTVREDQDKSK